MIDRALLARLRIEPLDRARHDRAAFSCGVERVNNFLQKTCARHQDEDHTRVRVACLDDSNIIIGFHALNSHSIDATKLPESARKKMPSYPTISAIYLSVVGVHENHQNSGIGSFLMADAFRTAVKVADLIGSHLLVLDALNERAAALYRKLNFVDLPGHAPRMIIRMAQVRKAVHAAGQKRA
jgi:ribosomal protein S18 acetylase RimI-like enzyme